MFFVDIELVINNKRIIILKFFEICCKMNKNVDLNEKNMGAQVKIADFCAKMYVF